jgi:aspartate/methionine/tyrosine aminotransferase
MTTHKEKKMLGLKPSPNAQALIEVRRQRNKFGLHTHDPEAIDLNRGHTAFVTPDHIREAACAAIRDGHTHYEDLIPLREAIAEKLAADNSIHVDPIKEIVVGSGTHLILFDVMQTFVGPGDEVIVVRPGSPTYYHFNTVLNGGTPVFINLKSERAFRLDPDDVAAAITPRTRIIGLTSPDTPCGVVQTRQDLERIAELAIQHDLLVVSDEIYEKLNFGVTDHFSIASLPGMHERTITVNGFSKYYAMTGWRVGYAAGPQHLIAPVQEIFHTNCIWLNTPAQYAALAALRGPQEATLEMKEEYRYRRQLLADGLSAIPGIDFVPTEGGYYTWVDVSRFGMHSTEFAQFALLHGQVRVGPGCSFGPGTGEDHLRLSFSETRENLSEGLRRLARVCNQLQE